MANYERPADADQRVEDAIKVIEALLPLEINDQLKRKFLSNCLWQITEAEGRTKYEIRYCSEAAQDAPLKELRHDHVAQRKAMVKALMVPNADVRTLVRQAKGCVVTKDEHKLLTAIGKTADGWERYGRAGIVVIDRKTGQPMQLEPPL